MKKLLPKENVEPTFFPAHGTQEEVVERAYQFITSNPIVTDWTGRTVYLPYGEKDGGYRDQVRNKAEHVVANEEKKGTHQRILHREKAKWLAMTLETIRHGRVRVRDDSGVLYFRKYGNTTHMVVTSTEGVFLKQATYDSGLVTQYPQDLREKEFPNAIVDNIR